MLLLTLKGAQMRFRIHRRRPLVGTALFAVALSAVGLFASACGPTATTPAAATSPSAGPGAAAKAGSTIMVSSVMSRPFQLHIPTSYRAGTPLPLVVMLHGYTANGATEESYLKLTPQSDLKGFLYATPDGTKESSTAAPRFWNATDACCNFYSSTVDDSAYVSGIITQLSKDFPVDPKRVYLIGHSNGAFMSYRMACDHADQIAAIVSLAGAMWNDTAKCTPKRPVSVLEVHGTADERIDYNGGAIVGNKYPPVTTTLADWRTFDGCSDAATPGQAMDLVSTVAGAETTVTTWSSGCKNNTKVALWSMKDAMHVPQFTPDFAPAAIDFLLGQTASGA
jgi:polyhydroxybutyrate depolymerase